MATADLKQIKPTSPPRHAGFKVRLLAAVLDIVAMAAPVFLLLCLVLGFQDCINAVSEAFNPEREAEFGSSSMVQELSAAILAVITVVLWVNWDGRTPGKKLTKTKIVSYPDYGSLTYATSTGRF